MESWMSKGLSLPNTGRRKLLSTSSSVMVSLSTEKKECMKRRRPTTHQMSQAFSIFKAFQVPDIRIPACSRQLAKTLSNSSSSTHLDQPVIFPETKSKKIGTASRDPHLIWRCRISLGSRTYAELANPSWQETPKQVEMEEHYREWPEGRTN